LKNAFCSVYTICFYLAITFASLHPDSCGHSKIFITIALNIDQWDPLMSDCTKHTAFNVANLTDIAKLWQKHWPLNHWPATSSIRLTYHIGTISHFKIPIQFFLDCILEIHKKWKNKLPIRFLFPPFCDRLEKTVCRIKGKGTI
jgi:hypothetical protein